MLKTSLIEIALDQINSSPSESMVHGCNHVSRQNKRTRRYRKNNMRRLKSTHLFQSR